MATKPIIILSLTSVALSSSDQETNRVNPEKQYFSRGPEHGVGTGLNPKIGHGITPNLKPRYSPPVQQETIPDLKDFLSLSGKVLFTDVTVSLNPVRRYKVSAESLNYISVSFPCH